MGPEAVQYLNSFQEGSWNPWVEVVVYPKVVADFLGDLSVGLRRNRFELGHKILDEKRQIRSYDFHIRPDFREQGRVLEGITVSPACEHQWLPAMLREIPAKS